MLTIIINHNDSSLDNLNNYIIFLQNIIKNNSIQLIIINCCNEINNLVIDNLNPNLNISIFNYSQDFCDSIYNDILQSTIYDTILFTNYNIYFTPILIDWINNNTIDENSYVKTNIFTLKSLPKEFFNNFSNSIYEDIALNINNISNESGIFNIDTNTYINIFNNNKDLHILDSKTLIENNTLFIQDTCDFLLINKNTLNKIGFNINNSNYNHTFQYLTLILIKNNLNMIKLPYLISVYKQFDSKNETFINIDSEFTTTTEFNKFVNYKIYNLNTKKTSTIIRNQVKTIKGYNTASTVQENELLKKINELNSIIENYKHNLSNQNIILDTEQINHLTQENNNLVEQNNILNDKINHLNEEINNLIQNINTLKQETNTLNEDNNHLVEQNNILNDKINHLNEKNNHFTHQNNNSENNIKTLKNNILLKLYDIINSDLD